jgi:thiamine pyrophosphokinase
MVNRLDPARQNVRRLGIAFLGGDGPPPAYCAALVKEAEPFLVAAADSGLIAAEKAGLRPGWIIGDMDSLGEEERRLDSYPAERVLRFPPHKDYTDTELVLSLLREKGCDTVWLIGGGGGRTDHLFAIRSLFERERPPLRWITAHDDIRCLEAPAELAVPAPGAVSVFPLGGGPWKAESSGLKWPLAGLPWERGFFGISNEASGENPAIRAEQGRFMVILERSV